MEVNNYEYYLKNIYLLRNTTAIWVLFKKKYLLSNTKIAGTVLKKIFIGFVVKRDGI